MSINLPEDFVGPFASFLGWRISQQRPTTRRKLGSLTDITATRFQDCFITYQNTTAIVVLCAETYVCAKYPDAPSDRSFTIKYILPREPPSAAIFDRLAETTSDMPKDAQLRQTNKSLMKCMELMNATVERHMKATQTKYNNVYD